MKLCSISIFLICCMLLFCGCTEITLETSYVNEEYGIGLDPPESWILNENSAEEDIVAWAPSQNSSVRYVVKKPCRLDEGLALSVFADDIQENYPELYDNFTQLYRDWLTIGGLTAYKTIYSYQGNGTLFQEQQIAVKHTREVYILKYAATFTEFEQYVEVINQSVKTFQVK